MNDYWTQAWRKVADSPEVRKNFTYDPDYLDKKIIQLELDLAHAKALKMAMESLTK